MGSGTARRAFRSSSDAREMASSANPSEKRFERFDTTRPRGVAQAPAGGVEAHQPQRAPDELAEPARGILALVERPAPVTPDRDGRRGAAQIERHRDPAGTGGR